MSETVFILGGARTPMTQYVGALKDVSAIDLGATAARGALARTGVPPVPAPVPVAPDQARDRVRASLHSSFLPFLRSRF